MTRWRHFAAASLLFGSLLGCNSGVDKDEYVAENMQLLEAFRPPPWAHQLNIVQNGFRRPSGADCELPPILASPDCAFVGYSTQILYEADPSKSSRDVIDFYVEQADASWSATVEENEYIRRSSGQIQHVARFTRGDAEVVVAPGARQGGDEPEAYWVVLNHDTSHRE
jgi:hypothetical protein